MGLIWEMLIGERWRRLCWRVRKGCWAMLSIYSKRLGIPIILIWGVMRDILPFIMPCWIMPRIVLRRLLMILIHSCYRKLRIRRTFFICLLALPIWRYFKCLSERIFGLFIHVIDSRELRLWSLLETKIINFFIELSKKDAELIETIPVKTLYFIMQPPMEICKWYNFWKAKAANKRVTRKEYTQYR